MEFDDYQNFTETTAQYPRTVQDLDPNANIGLFYVALGLAGEAGEIANKVKKVLRDNNGVLTPEKAAELSKELGDSCWYLAATARELGRTLNEVAHENVAKLTDRKERGVIKGDGDNR